MNDRNYFLLRTLFVGFVLLIISGVPHHGQAQKKLWMRIDEAAAICFRSTGEKATLFGVTGLPSFSF